MAGREYVELPFYGSADPEEFLEWVQFMDLELRKFPESKRMLRVKEFVPTRYEEYLFRHKKNIMQGF